MALAGSTGALVGHGTVSFFSDEETFSNNSIKSSRARGGVVRINVDPEASLMPSDKSVRFPVSVPNIADRNENPAFVCVETRGCPTDTLNHNSPDRLRVQLVLECGEDRPLLTGSLREVLDQLQRGIVLSCDNDPCLDPGGDGLALRLEVLEDFITGTNSDYNFQFAVDFTAEQCRYNEPASIGSDPGLLDLRGCSTGGECPAPGGKGISFIAFCRKDETGRPMIGEKSVRIEELNDEPTEILWSVTDGAGVDYVVVFGGNCWTFYDYRGIEAYNGVATTGGYTDYDAWLSSDPGNSGNGGACDRPSLTDKLPMDFSCPQGNSGSNGGGLQSCPCEVAEYVVGPGNGDGFQGSSIKYDTDTGKFE